MTHKLQQRTNRFYILYISTIISNSQQKCIKEKYNYNILSTIQYNCNKHCDTINEPQQLYKYDYNQTPTKNSI